MNITEYYKTIRASIEKRMPELTLQLEKEPGGRTGISISKEGEKASPLLWLDDYYDRYTNGQPLNETIRDIIHDWKKVMSHIPDISEPDIRNWEKAKHRIFLTLTAGSLPQPEDTICKDWLDMKLTLRYCITIADGILQSFPVPGKMAEEHWHITEKELLHTARENTEALFPASLKNLYRIIASLPSKYAEEPYTEPEELIHGNEPLPFDLYVLTNQGSLYGAAAISYKGLLNRLYRRFGKPFYVVPSSVHETILYPETEKERLKKQYSPEKMKRIIFAVNRGTLAPKERLSDSLYYYDGNKLTITETGGKDDE